MKRRQFLSQGTMTMASVGFLSQMPTAIFAAPINKGIALPIGFQSYVLREDIGKDLNGTLNKMAGMGYEYVEMCSPKGYLGPFEPLAKYSGKELMQQITDTGMKCNSSHFTWDEMKGNLDERIEFANEMGLEHFVASGGLHSESLDDLKEKCTQLNAMGEKIKKAGMIAGFHNHISEFETKFDGKYEYDVILELLDPEAVKMQYQTQPITMGVQGSAYFNKFPGRFISTHMQDYNPKDTTKEIALGQGIADWKDFFAAAKKGGVQVAYVEMESNPGTLKDSVRYLKNL
ncbi:Sugar phosphate isomerase/epimerase [Pricia antarctica]|uniref:Sugar phosphate isomerase/epimerase n=1 Tax=Pricia antarctica TaxID=641691 RepID=A0A1G7FHY0_9FLAO|nr:TIM barrel protein [Pricia antarctica]SDE75513.1 Sugar phosphate isomerase/epimerase [Pricia antarctica]